MKHLGTCVGRIVATCLIVATGAPTLAQPAPHWVPLPKDQEAVATAMLKARTPGAPHALLASLAGEWAFTARVWIDPAGAPSESTGTAVYTMLLGGRYLQATHRGHVIGLPFEGVGLRAHDNTTGQYQSVWMDTLSTTLMYMTGTYDAAARAFTMRGEVSDLVTPAVTVRVRELLTIVDRDAHRMEMFETRDGKEAKVLEIAYARKP